MLSNGVQFNTTSTKDRHFHHVCLFNVFCPISSMLSLFNQVEPAISKQVEFSNGSMHADDTRHEFTNKLKTSEGKMAPSTPSQNFKMVLCPHIDFFGDVA